jgi:hypothetical protein
MAGIKGQGTGNRNAVGNRGGGRYGKGREWLENNFLENLMTQEIDVQEIKRRIKSGKFLLGEFMLYRAVVEEKDAVLIKLIDKLFGDGRQRIKPIQNEPLTEEERAELSDALDRAFEEFPKIGYKPRLRLK